MINELSAKNLYDVWSSESECIQILDFRAYSEYFKCRIPGSKSYIEKSFKKNLFTKFSDIAFFLIEAPDHIVEDLADDHKIQNVFTIMGGFEAWLKAGYPTAPLVFKSKES